MDIDNTPLAPPAAQSPESPALASSAPGSAEKAVPEDVRVPWTWFDLLLLAVLGFCLSVLLSLALAWVFGRFGVTPAQIKKSPGFFTAIHQALLFLLLLAYLIAQVRLNFGAPFWRTIGWRGLEPKAVPRALRYFGFVMLGFFLAVFVEVMSVQFGTRAKLPVQALFQDRRAAMLIMVTSVLGAPVFEETIFRGYIYPVVARSFGITAGVLGTGILFGLMHAPQLWGGWVQISMLVLVGIVLTYVRATTRTVLAGFLIHISYNLSISFAVVLVSHGLRLISPHH